MKVNFKKGNKCENDILLEIETQGAEITRAIDFAYYINILGINEIRIIDAKKLNIDKHNWFKNLILKALDDSTKGIDWSIIDDNYIKNLANFPYYAKGIQEFLEKRKNGNTK